MLIGAFGPEGRDQVVLHLVQFQPGYAFRLTLVGDRFKYYAADTTLNIAFAPMQAPEPARGMAGTIGKTGYFDAGSWTLYGKEATVANALQPPDDIGAKATSLSFWRRGTKHTQLDLASMKAPMAALRKCMDDLVKMWGLDPRVMASLTRQPTPIGKPQNWLQSTIIPEML